MGLLPQCLLQPAAHSQTASSLPKAATEARPGRYQYPPLARGGLPRESSNEQTGVGFKGMNQTAADIGTLEEGTGWKLKWNALDVLSGLRSEEGTLPGKGLHSTRPRHDGPGQAHQAVRFALGRRT